MFLLKVENARKEMGDRTLFDQVNLEISPGEKVALTGRNGIGKTTLIQAIMGRTELDGGQIQRFVPLSEWGWLEQALTVEPHVTLLDFVRMGSGTVYEAWEQFQCAGQLLEACSNQAQMEEMVDLFTKAHEAFMNIGGYEWESQIENSLTRLHLPKHTWTVPYSELSGGQKTRAQIVRLMVLKPKMLVLDEPTNHLDSETLVWMETWLKEYNGSALIVTHDRTFMDHVADATVELTEHGTRKYRGGYSAFREQRDLEIQTQQTLFDKQERERRQLKEAIQQYKEWYDSAHSAAGERNPFGKKRAMKNATRFKAKERALERLEQQAVEKPQGDPQARIDFQPGQFDAKTLVVMNDVGVAYGNHEVFSGVKLTVSRGDRIAILGPNGAGKTTLLKTLTGQLIANRGFVGLHPQLRVGYFDQELHRLDLDATVLDAILAIPGMTQSYARTILATFLFRKDDVFKRIGDLSMGERCRVAFVQLYLSAVNLLVLDEPTNYLDIQTRERVEEALAEYPGALVLVSHDRYLVRKVANRVVAVEQGRVSDFAGTYEEYLAQTDELRAARDNGVQNETRQLELVLTQLMSMDASEDPDEQRMLMKRIRETGNRLRSLQSASE